MFELGDQSQAILFITSECTKNCSFCIMQDKLNKKYFMKFNIFKSLIDKIDTTKYINLYGGEPTSHKDVFNMIEYCISKKKYINLSSNFLFGKDIRESIIRLSYLNKDFGSTFNLFCNLQELNNETESIVIENFIEINKIIPVIPLFVIDYSKDTFEYINYIKYTLNKIFLNKENSFFIAIPKITNNCKECSQLINNYKVGDFNYFLAKELNISGYKGSFENHIYKCSIDSKEKYQIINEYLKNTSIVTSCGGGYMIDENYLYFCNSNRNIWIEHTNYKTMELAYSDLLKTISDSMICKKCEEHCFKCASIGVFE